MTSRAALFALLAVWGVGLSPVLPAVAEDMAADSLPEASGEARLGFTDRVWSRSDDGVLPGTMKIFLSDGTLVQDSCWETHRLSPWKFTSAEALSWDEDGRPVEAKIVALADCELVLAINGSEEHYTATPLPYLIVDRPQV